MMAKSSVNSGQGFIKDYYYYVLYLDQEHILLLQKLQNYVHYNYFSVESIIYRINI